MSHDEFFDAVDYMGIAEATWVATDGLFTKFVEAMVIRDPSAITELQETFAEIKERVTDAAPSRIRLFAIHQHLTLIQNLVLVESFGAMFDKRAKQHMVSLGAILTGCKRQIATIESVCGQDFKDSLEVAAK